MEKNFLPDLLKSCHFDISINATMDPVACTVCVLGACATVGYVYKTKKESERIASVS